MKKKNVEINYLKLTGIAIFLILLGLFAYFIYVYNFIEKEKSAGHNETINFLLSETDMVEIEKITSFQSKNAYHIATGKKVDSNDLIAFVPVDNPKDFILISTDETIAEERMKETWEKSCENCNFVSLNLAMIEEKPLWEFTYIDNSNRYVFDYYDLYDGTQYEQLKLKRRYK